MFILNESVAGEIIGSKELRRNLASALDFTDEWIVLRAKQNKPNGPLTTYAALVAISNYNKKTFSEIVIDEKAQASEKNSAAVSTV